MKCIKIFSSGKFMYIKRNPMYINIILCTNPGGFAESIWIFARCKMDVHYQKNKNGYARTIPNSDYYKKNNKTLIERLI